LEFVWDIALLGETERDGRGLIRDGVSHKRVPTPLYKRGVPILRIRAGALHHERTMGVRNTTFSQVVIPPRGFVRFDNPMKVSTKLLEPLLDEMLRVLFDGFDLAH
jgi:hypothetical protein